MNSHVVTPTQAKLYEAHKARLARMGMSGNQAAKEYARAERQRELKEAEEARIQREMAEYLLKIEALAESNNIALRRPDDYMLAIYGKTL